MTMTVRDGRPGLTRSVADFMRCKVCGRVAKLEGVVDFNRACLPVRYPEGLSGIPVYYWRCLECDLLFTDAMDAFSDADWRGLIYDDRYYTILDRDYDSVRPASNARMMMAVLNAHRTVYPSITGLDYGGGNGVMASILSRKGIRYFTYDPFGHTNISESMLGSCNVISAFEVAEHTTDPIATFKDILAWAADRFLLVIGTQCHDGLIDDSGSLDWSYVAPRNGHVSIYGAATMAHLASQLEVDYLQVSRGTHLFGRGVPLVSYKRRLILFKIRQRFFG